MFNTLYMCQTFNVIGVKKKTTKHPLKLLYYDESGPTTVGDQQLPPARRVRSEPGEAYRLALRPGWSGGANPGRYRCHNAIFGFPIRQPIIPGEYSKP
jgi:hypothetical protein